MIKSCSQRWGEDATQDALEWLLKVDAPKGRQDFERVLRWKARLRAITFGVVSKASPEVSLWDDGNDLRYEANQHERAIARIELEGIPELVNHELGLTRVPKTTRWRLRGKAR